MPTPVPDETYNSPGTIGFIITFAVAVGAVSNQKDEISIGNTRETSPGRLG
jgi:hypothetical protein